MKRAVDYEQLSKEISNCFKPGISTNCTLSADSMKELIAKKQLWYYSWDGGLLLFIENGDIFSLYYYLLDDKVLPALSWPKKVVLEIPFRPKADKSIISFWEKIGFKNMFTRVRLVHTTQELEKQVEIPSRVEAQEAYSLLLSCFDVDTGCIPSVEQLEKDAMNGLLLSRRDKEGQLIALLQVQPKRRVAELHHLAVLPEYRGEGLAKALIQEFIECFGDKTLQLWVREDYAVARHIYEKNGFCPDGWTSEVMIRKG